MKTGGRRSAAAHAADILTLPVVPRPSALPSLTPQQAVEWDAIVARMPSTWFLRETEPMLESYCKQIILLRELGQQLEAAKGTPDWERLFKLHNDGNKVLVLLATRMRLTQQSTYDKSKKKPVQAASPWDSSR
jgi:hypothetical protein